MKYLFTYPEKCTGCRQCAIACALSKTGECNPKTGAINVLRDEFERYEIQFVCLQCEDPECVPVCMKNAIAKGPDGIVRIDKDEVPVRLEEEGTPALPSPLDDTTSTRKDN